MPAQSSELVVLDYGVIADRFHSLIAAMGNKLEREFPRHLSSHPGTQPLVTGLYRTADNVYSAIRALLADDPPHRNYREFAPSVAPLTRTLVEVLSTIIFIFHDLKDRTAWFYKAGYRDLALELESIQTRRGMDPQWSDFIAGLTAHILRIQALYGVTPAEAAAPRKITKWPNPGGMRVHGGLSKERREYLVYLNDWQYRTLSQDTHANLLGIVRRFPLFAFDQPRDERLAKLEHLRSLYVTASIATMLAIITELELECRFHLLERARYVWTVVGDWDDLVKEFYETFYVPVFRKAGLR